jgi:hypothetical protein
VTSALVVPEISEHEIHPGLLAIEKGFRAGFQPIQDTFNISQSWNISQCTPPKTLVKLPTPNDGNDSWVFVSQSGDSRCVTIEYAGYSGFFNAVWLTWNHPGQTTVTCRSGGMGGSPYEGNNILLFTVFACG